MTIEKQKNPSASCRPARRHSRWAPRALGRFRLRLSRGSSLYPETSVFAPRPCRHSAEPTVAAQRVTPRAGVMAAPSEKQGAGPSLVTEQNSAVSSPILEASPPAPEPSSPNAAASEAIPRPPAAASAAPELPFAPPPLGLASPAEAAPRSLPGIGNLGPETFRQRFRQFRYHDAAGPREAFRQLRELSRQWLRPDIRTKEQIVEMLVQEQLLAILPEAARARRQSRRTDVRITG
ncbi:SCAN domain-containing protein 1 [Choloepus didactylus]|uniref:SCAN domain-containing protein 1 n=1 Tax=Choloepus didactylus TaxID=27675 RepID=UPI00189FC7CD|nr:SCAN domain-containing protein 1 [Choloepus didactylus]